MSFAERIGAVTPIRSYEIVKIAYIKAYEILVELYIHDTISDPCAVCGTGISFILRGGFHMKKGLITTEQLFNRLPRCKAIFERYTESYLGSWQGRLFGRIRS